MCQSQRLFESIFWRVILSEVALREAEGNAVEGPLQCSNDQRRVKAFSRRRRFFSRPLREGGDFDLLVEFSLPQAGALSITHPDPIPR